MIKTIIIFLLISHSLADEMSKKYDVELIFGHANSKIINKNFKGLNQLNDVLEFSN